MKKLSLIVKREEYYGISLYVDKDFDEDWDSPIIKKVLKEFPDTSRKIILPQYDEVDMMNDGFMKVEPKHYLTSEGELKSIV